jgi:hypothetical protein
MFVRIKGAGASSISGVRGEFLVNAPNNKTTRFYNLNLRHPCKKAEDYLQNNLAAIFFGEISIEDILKGDHTQLTARQAAEARAFCKIANNADQNIVIVTIADDKVWIYKPMGAVRDGEIISYQDKRSASHGGQNDREKLLPIEHLIPGAVEPGGYRRIQDVPLILASMKANQYFARSTFTEIRPERHPGNIFAIQCEINKHPAKVPELLDCLSSIELETLVAKLFEESGFFVPAYKGGFLQNIDLFVRTLSTKPITFMGRDWHANVTYALQVKRDHGGMSTSLADWINADPMHRVLVTASDLSARDRQKFGSSCLCLQDIKEALKACSSTKKWLDESLRWMRPSPDSSQTTTVM